MSGTVRPSDSWASGLSYESYVGRWSRLVAAEFVARLAVVPGARWLDVGSGTGALTETVLVCCAPAEVVGVEPSAPFREYAAAHVPDPRASFRAGDARALPVDDDTFDVVVSGLVLNFVPDRSAALAEMRRAARSGGTVSAYVWDYPGEMQLMTHFWAAAVALDPAALSLDEAARFDFCRPDPLRRLFTEAGLLDVDVEEIVVPTDFPSFDAYWTPFLGGTGTAPTYAMSLAEDERAALRDALRARLPTADDGSIHLTARAWAVRGTAG
ncbi:methyltransferase domain-containing protein [Blastococcus sp. CT_GayMR16]|uniref:class I SAM-dependent methyltransferase n=1 Tax=Blastococcus sp. CT_GayMR16 TaxID=2559607 RepID=UPI0010748AA4|nr:methyltransferase domain-containing protein [Blastococcus sp. CT_GayMR16]TFV91353.1 methyltransferase domain-containing protein [Blastococcus sp. CT_GayMR16]